MGFNTQNWRSCYVRRDAALATASATPLAFTWDAAGHNPNGLWSSTVNQTRVTIDKPGLYLVEALAHISGAHDAAAYIEVKKNGTAVTGSRYTTGVARTAAGSVVTHTSVLCATGDYIEVFVLQTSGGALNITGHCSVTLQQPQQDWTADTEAV